jgi:hypothetical protein
VLHRGQQVHDRKESLVRSHVDEQRVRGGAARHAQERRHFVPALAVLDQVKREVVLGVGSDEDPKALLESELDIPVRKRAVYDVEICAGARIAEPPRGDACSH